jgi:peroxiredoxin Q/BCP
MTTMALAGLLLVVSVMAGEEAGKKAVLDVGDEAPAFQLTGSDGKTYSLADFAGKQAVVIAWFPKAFTGG